MGSLGRVRSGRGRTPGERRWARLRGCGCGGGWRGVVIERVESEDEKDAALADIEKECLPVCKRKVKEASMCKASFLREIAMGMGRAELAVIGSFLWADKKLIRVGENSRGEFENVNVHRTKLRE
ncbi:hypothetical protein DY000_02056769 [Brassica cretica]|uniref:Uncharacterized protein n=1 Tax=Brassica cretica TaxID=69181 RepID=A0ABQ7A6S6_BRACR|nr:hypothetical protein DY000_02056769 [Brassica cretica]